MLLAALQSHDEAPWELPSRLQVWFKGPGPRVLFGQGAWDDIGKIHAPTLIGITLAALAFLSYHRGLLDIPELKSFHLRFQTKAKRLAHEFQDMRPMRETLQKAAMSRSSPKTCVQSVKRKLAVTISATRS
jgi:hypothetical protein